MNLTLLVPAINDALNVSHDTDACYGFFKPFTIAQMVMQMFGFNERYFYLTLGRTNLKWGKKKLNVLVLAVIYKGVATPPSSNGWY